VLDADFAPQQPILLRTLGLFDDPRVGLVQKPQILHDPPSAPAQPWNVVLLGG